MTTRTIDFTPAELRLIAQWANNAWHDLDQARILTRPDSPQEKSAEADQEFIENIQAKLRGIK